MVLTAAKLRKWSTPEKTKIPPISRQASVATMSVMGGLRLHWMPRFLPKLRPQGFAPASQPCSARLKSALVRRDSLVPVARMEEVSIAGSRPAASVLDLETVARRKRPAIEAQLRDGGRTSRLPAAAPSA